MSVICFFNRDLEATGLLITLRLNRRNLIFWGYRYRIADSLALFQLRPSIRSWFIRMAFPLESPKRGLNINAITLLKNLGACIIVINYNIILRYPLLQPVFLQIDDFQFFHGWYGWLCFH